jgi:N-acetylmuramoyl-L-alanine amidase
VDFAHNKNADYFISIHLDSFAASKNHFAVYYWFKGGSYSKEGKKFAENVSSAVTPRGFTKSVVKTANHFVTRSTRIPAILIECGNIQNSDNAKEVGNARFIQELARGIDTYVQNAE